MAGMLQRAVTAVRDHSGKDCPGPDVLAAYYERALSPAEQQHWEGHFSSCALCQAQLAALARSEPLPRPQQLRFWRWHGALRWLPPAAVALAAIAIWIAVRPNNPLHWFEKKHPEVATTAPVAPNRQDELKEATRSEAPAPPAPESTSKGKPSPATVEKQQEKAAKPAVNFGSLKMAPRKEMAEGAMARIAPPTVAEKRALPPPVAENAVAAGQTVAPGEDKPAQGRAAPTVSAEAAPAAPAPSPSASRAESSSSKIRHGYAIGGAAGGAFQAGQSILEVRSAEVLIASPDPAVQWRIGVGGTIERTGDGGKTWQGQFVSGGPGLVAGSAPSTKVCWLAGRAGTILRTKDGENWEKIASPAPLDFTGIKAKDERTATVIGADGRTFSTQDGGKTWQAVQQGR